MSAPQFFGPRGIALDNSGNIYVADSQNHRIQKFRSDGTLLMRWGSFGRGNGQFMLPTGIAVDRQGYIYVADTENFRIQKFRPDFSFLRAWGSNGRADGQFMLPYGITVDSQLNVFVVDHSNHRVQKFVNDGTFIQKWGSRGSSKDNFEYPWGIATDASGNVYVADTNNNAIKIFQNNGTYLNSIAVNQPSNLTVTSFGEIFVTTGASGVQALSNGRIIAAWGRGGNRDGEFNVPWGICYWRKTLYVVDNGNGRIQVFTPDGEFIRSWGSRGTA